MGSNKIKENHNREKTKKMKKKTSKPHKKGDQGCSSKKNNGARKRFQKYPKRA